MKTIITILLSCVVFSQSVFANGWTLSPDCKSIKTNSIEDPSLTIAVSTYKTNFNRYPFIAFTYYKDGLYRGDEGVKSRNEIITKFNGVNVYIDSAMDNYGAFYNSPKTLEGMEYIYKQLLNKNKLVLNYDDVTRTFNADGFRSALKEMLSCEPI